MLSLKQDRYYTDKQKKGDSTMKNIRFVLLCELFLFAAVFILNIIMGNWGFSAIVYF